MSTLIWMLMGLVFLLNFLKSDFQIQEIDQNIEISKC